MKAKSIEPLQQGIQGRTSIAQPLPTFIFLLFMLSKTMEETCPPPMMLNQQFLFDLRHYLRLLFSPATLTRYVVT